MDDIPNTSNKRLIDANVLDEEVRKFFLAITGNPKQATVVRKCKESFRRMIDEQKTVYANDDWILVKRETAERIRVLSCTTIKKIRKRRLGR